MSDKIQIPFHPVSIGIILKNQVIKSFYFNILQNYS